MLNLIKFNYGSLKFFFLEFHSVKCLIKDKFSLLFDSLKLLFYWNISTNKYKINFYANMLH